MRWVGHVACMEVTHVYKILVTKPRGKRPLGRCRCTYEDNIESDIKEIGCEVWTEFK